MRPLIRPRGAHAVDAPALRGHLTVLLAGMALAFLDLSINGFDLLYDPVGLLLAAVALANARTAVDDDAFRSRALLAVALSALNALTQVASDLAVPGAAEATFVLGGVQPVTVAYALLRVTELIGAGGASRSWLVAIAVLVTGWAVAVVLLAGEVTPATAVVAAVVGLTSLATFLVALVRTRAAVAATT